MPSEIIVCDCIPVKFVVKNTGCGDAKNVVVCSQLPEGWTTVDGKDTLAFNAGTLKDGQEKEFCATVKSSRTGQFSTAAQAIGDCGLRCRCRRDHERRQARADRDLRNAPATATSARRFRWTSS